MGEVCFKDFLEGMCGIFNLIPVFILIFGWTMYSRAIAGRRMDWRRLSIPLSFSIASALVLRTFPYISVFLVSVAYMVFLLSPRLFERESDFKEPLTYVYVLVGMIVSGVLLAVKGLNPDTLFFSVNVISFSFFFHLIGIRGILPSFFLTSTLVPPLLLNCPSGISHPIFLGLAFLSAVVELHSSFVKERRDMRMYGSLSVITLLVLVVMFVGAGTCVLSKRSQSVLALVEKRVSLVAREILSRRLAGESLEEIVKDLMVPWEISSVVVEKSGNVLDVYSTGEKTCLVGEYERDGVRCVVSVSTPFTGLIRTIMGILITLVGMFTTVIVLFQKFHYSRWTKYLEMELESKTVELSSANQELVAMNEELVAMNRDIEEMYATLSDLSGRMSEFLELVENLSISMDMEELFRKLAESIGRLLRIDYSGFSVLNVGTGEIVLKEGFGTNSLDLDVENFILKIYYEGTLDMSSEEKRFLVMVTSVVGFIVQAKLTFEELKGTQKLAMHALELLDAIMDTESRKDIEEVILKRSKMLFDDTVLVGIAWKDDLKGDSLEVRFMRVESEKPNVEVLRRRGIMRIVLERGEEYLVNDVRRDPNFLVVDFRTRSALAVPLKYKGDIEGVIIIERSNINAFKTADINALKLFSRITTMTLQRIEYYEELKRTVVEAIEALSKMAEMKFPYIRGHGKRVAVYAKEIAMRLGLSEDSIRRIEFASILHDIGKVAVEDRILNKPSSLTKEEFEKIKIHPVVGEELVKGIFQDVATLIRYHHESWSGGGYPDGLKGEEIPLEARILAIANSFDSLTSDRPYREAYSLKEALDILRRNERGQWDPSILPIALEVFESLYEKVRGMDSRGLDVSDGNSPWSDNDSFGKVHKQHENGAPSREQEEELQAEGERGDSDLERGEGDRGDDKEGRGELLR